MDSTISANINEIPFTSKKMTLFIIFSLNDISARFTIFNSNIIPKEIIYLIINEVIYRIKCGLCNDFLGNFAYDIDNISYKEAFHKDLKLDKYSYRCFNCKNRFCENCSDIGKHRSRYCENCSYVGKKKKIRNGPCVS